MPRLSRFSLTSTHEDNALTMTTLSKGSSSSGKQTSARRKLSLYSLSSLFSKSFFRSKTGRSRDPSPQPVLQNPLPPGNLIVPVTRVRSRSAPFSEMSPIAETHKETISDSESIPLESGIHNLLHVSPECSMINIVHCYRDAEEEEENSEEPEVICFISSSDESCCSSVSRSGSSLCVDGVGGGGDDLLVVTQSSCNNLHAPNLIHHASPCSSPRSPHRCVVAPSSNEAFNTQRMLSQTQSPTAVHFHPSAATVAAASSLTSRPSPCPRSSESEISLTPNGTHSRSMHILTKFLFITPPPTLSLSLFILWFFRNSLKYDSSVNVGHRLWKFWAALWHYLSRVVWCSLQLMWDLWSANSLVSVYLQLNSNSNDRLFNAIKDFSHFWCPKKPRNCSYRIRGSVKSFKKYLKRTHNSPRLNSQKILKKVSKSRIKIFIYHAEMNSSETSWMYIFQQRRVFRIAWDPLEVEWLLDDPPATVTGFLHLLLRQLTFPYRIQPT